MIVWSTRPLFVQNAGIDTDDEDDVDGWHFSSFIEDLCMAATAVLPSVHHKLVSFHCRLDKRRNRFSLDVQFSILYHYYGANGCSRLAVTDEITCVVIVLVYDSVIRVTSNDVLKWLTSNAIKRAQIQSRRIRHVNRTNKRTGITTFKKMIV